MFNTDIYIYIYTYSFCNNTDNVSNYDIVLWTTVFLKFFFNGQPQPPNDQLLAGCQEQRRSKIEFQCGDPVVMGILAGPPPKLPPQGFIKALWSGLINHWFPLIRPS